MKRNMREKFIPYTERNSDYQTEMIDSTEYTDPIYNMNRAEFMKNVQLGLPEANIQFLNGRAIQPSSLIENIEEAMIDADRLANETLASEIKSYKIKLAKENNDSAFKEKIDSATSESKHEETKSGGAPTEK